MSNDSYICSKCGCRASSGNGIYYDSKTKMPVCKSCFDKAEKYQIQPAEKEAKQPTVKSMVIKIIIGLFLLFTGFQDSDGSSSVDFFFIAVGLVIIAWGVLPYLKAMKAKRDSAEYEKSVIENKRTEEALLTQICPNCGAATHGKSCEYCGSSLK